MASTHENYQCYTPILNRIYDQLINLMSYHSRISVIRVDLRFPDAPILSHKEEGRLLSAYIGKIKASLRLLGNYGRSNVVYVAVKEIGEVKGKSHYHLFFGFQSKFRSLGEINGSGHTGAWRTIDEIWTQLSGGTTHIVPKVYSCERGNVKDLEDCFYHLSYLAKENTKHFGTGEHYKRYTSSRLPPKPGTFPWLTELDEVS